MIPQPFLSESNVDLDFRWHLAYLCQVFTSSYQHDGVLDVWYPAAHLLDPLC